MGNLGYLDLQNIVSLKYDRDFQCIGVCEAITCRCSKIKKIEIESVDIPKLSEIIYNIYFDNSDRSIRDLKLSDLLNNITKSLNMYTIDRILRINKIWEKSSLDISLMQGYYGEEINDVVINDEKIKTIKKQLNKAFSLENITDRINYLLELEYGYVLPKLIGKNYKIKKVDKGEIKTLSEEHYDKSNKKYLIHYDDINYNGIKGIAIKENGYYRLIDGHHRYSMTNNKKIKMIIAS